MFIVEQNVDSQLSGPYAVALIEHLEHTGLEDLNDVCAYSAL